jgi:hypothetical protein
VYPLGPDVDAPDKLGEMIEVAEAIGAEFDFARVDLYNPNGEAVLFGEITIAPGSGHEGFTPTRRDFDLGSYWDLDADRND